MTNMVKATRCRLFAALLATLAAVCASGALAQGDGTRPVSAEPNHKIRFDNGAVRLYVVSLPAGKGTLMHEHRADSFSVIFSDAGMIVEPLGSEPMGYQPPAGFVGFTPAPNPYSHRVIAPGQSPFHVAALELISPPQGAPHAVRRTSPAFTIALENSRGRAYRYVLGPGESTGPFQRFARTAIFAVSSGRISETGEGKTPRLWDFEAGHFRWTDAPEQLSIKNEGAAKVEVVEVEVF